MKRLITNLRIWLLTKRLIRELTAVSTAIESWLKTVAQINGKVVDDGGKGEV